MNDLLDETLPPEKDSALFTAEAARKSKLWTWIYLGVSLVHFIFYALSSADQLTGRSTPYKTGHYIGTFMGPFILYLFLGLIIWLIAWPFTRKAITWHRVAMYSAIAGGVILTLVLFSTLLVFMLRQG